MKDYGALVENSYTDQYDTKKYIKVYSNVVIPRGGDGTLIKAIHKYKHLNLPFYGVQGGTVGFLMNKTLEYIQDCEKIQLNLIEITLKTKTGTKTYEAFNEICIGGDPRYFIDFRVKEKDDIIGRFKGSGVIISTPQGSTGINKTNRGSILPLKANLWSITGDKTLRNIDYVIKPRNIKITMKSRLPVVVLIDGTNKIVHDVQEVQIKEGKTVHLLIKDYKKFIKKRRI